MNPETVRALGLDAGSTATKLVGVDEKGALVWNVLLPTHPRMEEQARELLDRAYAAGVPKDVPLVATGYGRNLARGAKRSVTEITCHARGAFRRVGNGGTLVDIGGQDSKVIVIASDGKVERFAMNDKCAAGTGRFLEVAANRLQMTLERFSEVALTALKEVPISSTCTVFAESEMISLIANGEPVPHIVRGLHRSLAKRVAALVRGTSPVPPFLLSGGVAQSSAVRQLLGEELGKNMIVPESPQLMGAYGAALIALG